MSEQRGDEITSPQGTGAVPNFLLGITPETVRDIRQTKPVTVDITHPGVGPYTVVEDSIDLEDSGTSALMYFVEAEGSDFKFFSLNKDEATAVAAALNGLAASHE